MAVDDKVEFIGNFLILFISYDLLNYILKPTRWLQQMNLLMLLTVHQVFCFVDFSSEVRRPAAIGMVQQHDLLVRVFYFNFGSRRTHAEDQRRLPFTHFRFKSAAIIF